MLTEAFKRRTGLGYRYGIWDLDIAAVDIADYIRS